MFFSWSAMIHCRLQKKKKKKKKNTKNWLLPLKDI